jgi:hypothetical protein
MANAQGSRAINRELDLLKELTPELKEEIRILREKLGDSGFEKLAEAMDLKTLNMSEREKNILEHYWRGNALQQYRAINRERSDLIGKNDIFETMFSKFEARHPDENFIPKGKPAGKSKGYSLSNSTAARAGHRTAEAVADDGSGEQGERKGEE